MPYSMDPKANRENPETPSPIISLHEQLIYKIAALDASVQGGFRRLDEKIDRMQLDLHESQIETNDRINSLDKEVHEAFLRKRARLDALEKDHVSRTEHLDVCHKVDDMKLWQEKMIARWSVVAGLVIIFWTVFGDAIKHAVGMP